MADAHVRRAVLLTRELAVDCAMTMFTQRADGPHALGVDPVAIRPTREEITICQAAAKAALGEKGSEQRAHANSLCADGLLDLEQGLGYLLCDRFAGTMPTPVEARRVGKRAAERLPEKKERERWKEKGKAARKAAKAAAADEEAVAAAGQAERDKAEAAFMSCEVAIRGLERAAEPAPPPPPSVPSSPEPSSCARAPPRPSEKAPTCAGGRAALEMTLSQEAASTIKAAFFVLHHTRRSPDTFYNEELEIAQVRYKHALRRLKRAYPGELLCDWTENSPERMFEWVLVWVAAGYAIPAAVAAAHMLQFPLLQVAAHHTHQHRERVAPMARWLGLELVTAP